MSGDTKSRRRTEKRNDLVEQFSESHEALQRAMEKDLRTGQETGRLTDGSDHRSAPKSDDGNENAIRLAALLEAARTQKANLAADTGDTTSRNDNSPRDRVPSPPIPHPNPDSDQDNHPRRDVTARPDMSDRSVVGPSMPPLVGRDEETETVAPAKIVLRLVLVAILVGAGIYPLVVPQTKDEPGAPVSATAEAPALPSVTSPGNGVMDDTGSAESATMDLKPTEAAPVTASAPEMAASANEPVQSPPEAVKDFVAAVVHAAPMAERARKLPLPATKVKSAAATAAPVVPANTRPPVTRRTADIPPPPPPAARPARISKSASVPTPVAAEPTAPPVVPVVPVPSSTVVGTEAVTAGEALVRTTSTDAAAPKTIAPPSQSSETTPAKEEASGGAAADSTPVATAEAAAPMGPVDVRRSADRRRPYFQRLGPPPARNPFRATPQVEQQPALFRNFSIDIE